MRKICVVVAATIILLGMLSGLLLAQDTSTPGFKRVAIILAPGISYNDLLEYYSNSTIIDLNKSSITRVKPVPPYNSLYYELSLINGFYWDLGNGIPLCNNTVLVFSKNNTSIEYPWEITNQSLVNNIWSPWKTIFVGIRSIDVSKVNNTVNYYYNLSRKIIPPTIFKIKINSSISWNYINESIGLFEENNTLILRVGDENSTVTNNVTEVITINVTKSGYLQTGLYDLKFYVFKLDNETYKIVTLGTIQRDQVFSANVIGFDKPVIPHIPFNILEQLTLNETLVLLNEIKGFYRDLINHIIGEAGLSEATIIYYPLIEEVRLRVNTNTSLTQNISSIAYSILEELVDTLYKRLGEDALIIIFSPYTIINTSSSEELFPQELVITPGIIRYNETMVKLLIEDNIDFKVVNINDQRFIVVDNYSIPYNGRLYGEGVVILLKTNRKAAIELIDASTVLGYLMSTPNLLGYSDIVLLNKYHDLSVEYSKLKTEYDILNSTANDLREELDKTKKELGDVRAEYENLTSKIAELEKQLEAERQRVQSLTTYLTAGLTSIVVIAVVYGFIVRSIVKGAKR